MDGLRELRWKPSTQPVFVRNVSNHPFVLHPLDHNWNPSSYGQWFKTRAMENWASNKARDTDKTSNQPKSDVTTNRAERLTNPNRYETSEEAAATLDLSIGWRKKEVSIGCGGKIKEQGKKQVTKCVHRNGLWLVFGVYLSLNGLVDFRKRCARTYTHSWAQNDFKHLIKMKIHVLRSIKI